MEKMTVTEKLKYYEEKEKKRLEAQKKYNEKRKDTTWRVSASLPVEYKQQLEELGIKSMNSFLNDIVSEYINNHKN